MLRRLLHWLFGDPSVRGRCSECGCVVPDGEPDCLDCYSSKIW
jgi:hypothetical protein